jgi:putative sterol carrier protein
MRLTRKRIESLAKLEGAVRFAVAGEDGFALVTHFGGGPVPDVPNASIAVDEDAYRELRSGELDPAAAFMNGRLKIEGDMQLAMQLALAALAAD